MRREKEKFLTFPALSEFNRVSGDNSSQWSAEEGIHAEASLLVFPIFMALVPIFGIGRKKEKDPPFLFSSVLPLFLLYYAFG